MRVTTLIATWLFLLGLPFNVVAFNIGDEVQLVERCLLGIPGHLSPGENKISHRFLSASSVTIRNIDSATNWHQVDTGNGLSPNQCFIEISKDENRQETKASK